MHAWTAALLAHELLDRLEEVEVQTREVIHASQLGIGGRGGVAIIADERADDGAVLLFDVGAVVLLVRAAAGEGDAPALAGVPTHFDRASGEAVTIRSYVHLLSDHVKAAHASGWALAEMNEALIDQAWLRKKPKWDVYAGTPISFVMVWRRRA